MSTLNVEAISHPTPGSNVTINGITPAGTNQLGNRNLVINGAMQVAQRGTSQASVTSTTYAGPDRFQHILSTAGTWTISQSTEAPEGFATSLKLDCTTANASLSASSLYLLGQKIEGLNVQHLDYNTVNAKTVTLSFWVRSNKTGTYVCEVTTHTSTRKISQTYTINSANTWEKKILQIPGDTGGSLPNTNTAEFNVYWWLVAGANWKSGTLNTTWGITADNNRVVGQTVNLADSTDNDFYLTGVQLEVGTVATPFEHRSYGDELAKCLRYYWLQEVRNATNYGHFCLLASYATTADVRGFINFPVPMRQIPALSNSDISHFVHLGGPAITAFYIADGGASYYNTGLGVSLSSAQTGGYASILRAFNTNNAELRWDAEL